MLDRTKAPETHEIDAVTLQIAEVTHLDNGARLHTIKSETQPVIRLDFVFKAGKWYEPKTGVSDLAAKMLMEGTLNYSAKQIAEQIAYYGASMDMNHGYDRTELTVYCLSKYIKELLPLMLDILQNPTFPEEEYVTLLKRTKQNIKVLRQKNNYLATHSLTKLIYGSEHPYVFGFEENDFDAIILEDLKEFYKNQFNTKNLEVFAFGDVSDDLYRHLTDNISLLQIKNADNTLISNREFKNLEKAYELVEVKDSLQSSIRLGRSFPLNSHQDYQKLKVMNEVFGGYFGSRLMKNIREDKGYTYGIYSAMSPKENDTLFFIGTDVNYTVTDDTISEIRTEIKKLQEENVPEEELDTVKNYMLGKFVNDISTIFEQGDKYKYMVLNQLPLDYYNNYIATIRNITSEEIKELAQNYLKEEDLALTIAGRKS